MTGAEIARRIDHTLLKAEASEEQIRKLCQEANTNGFYSVCVNPRWIPLAATCLKGGPAVPITVVGFPLGANGSHAKAFEAEHALRLGAKEIDMVIDLGAIKSGAWKEAEEDIRTVAKACGTTPLKVILETCYLNEEEIRTACKASVNAGARFVKTSTGFGTGGATVEHIKLMRSVVGPDFGVKASGGIRDRAGAEALLKAGATRLGCSASVAIVSGTGGASRDGY